MVILTVDAISDTGLDVIDNIRFVRGCRSDVLEHIILDTNFFWRNGPVNLVSLFLISIFSNL